MEDLGREEVERDERIWLFFFADLIGVVKNDSKLTLNQYKVTPLITQKVPHLIGTFCEVKLTKI